MMSVEVIASPQKVGDAMSPSVGRLVPKGTHPTSRGGQVTVVQQFAEPRGIQLSCHPVKGVGRGLF